MDSETVRGRRLGRAVAAAHYIPLITDKDETMDETESSDDGELGLIE